MQYAIVRMFPEAEALVPKPKVGDVFVPASRARAQALMQAGLIRATMDRSAPRPAKKLLSKAGRKYLKAKAR